MFTLHRRDAHPPQGLGHYSQDWLRWFDEQDQRWLPVVPGHDTLVVDLEDVPARSWRAGLRSTRGSTAAEASSRFVGHATSVDRRWPTYTVTSAAFPRVRNLPDTVLPDEAWVPGMRAALDELRRDLEDEGWVLVGRGMQPWAYRYTRPRVDWPSNGEAPSRNGTQPSPPLRRA